MWCIWGVWRLRGECAICVVCEVSVCRAWGVWRDRSSTEPVRRATNHTSNRKRNRERKQSNGQTNRKQKQPNSKRQLSDPKARNTSTDTGASHHPTHTHAHIPCRQRRPGGPGERWNFAASCTGRGISSSISNVPLIQLIQLILPKSGPRLLQY